MNDIKGRRNFIRKAGKYSLVLASSLAGISVLRVMLPSVSGNSKKHKLGKVEEYQYGTFTYVESAEVFVIRDYEGVRAVSARCTHLGCIIERKEDQFVCPCHGSCFNDEGKRLAGAAMRDLPWYELNIVPGGQLEADLNTLVDPDYKLLKA